MELIKEIVLRLHTELMQGRGIERISSPELEIRPRNGITSESIVTLLLDIEDELDIELDDYLMEIRVCKTIGDFIGIIETAYKNKGKE